MHYFLGGNGGYLDATLEILAHPATVLGLGDGGAHVDLVCDAGYPSFVLWYWVRDRARGTLPLETAIGVLTSEPARMYGLRDRGVVAPGYKADLNVLDTDAIKPHPVEIVYDLPAGAKRILQRADGFVATIVNGEVVQRDGKTPAPVPAASCGARTSAAAARSHAAPAPLHRSSRSTTTSSSRRTCSTAACRQHLADHAPRVVEFDDGRQAWVLDGNLYPEHRAQRGGGPSEGRVVDGPRALRRDAQGLLGHPRPHRRHGPRRHLGVALLPVADRRVRRRRRSRAAPTPSSAWPACARGTTGTTRCGRAPIPTASSRCSIAWLRDPEVAAADDARATPSAGSRP